MSTDEPGGGEVLRARDLVKTFGRDGAEVHALRGVDLSVRRGECIAIIGPSGSGKSTLLTLLGGLERPTAGGVWVESVDVTALGDRERTLLRRRRLGFVFQSFNLIPALDVLENVALPLRLDGVAAREAAGRAAEALEAVGMAHRLTHHPGQISGGEQQRVAVARALVIRPAVLLADEPTGSLDTASSGRLAALFRRAVDERGQAVVLVTHDPRLAGHADRLVQILDGRVRYDGPPTEERLWHGVPGEGGGG